MVTRSADTDVNDLCGIHIRIIVKLIERRAARIFIITKGGVIVKMGINMENADPLWMPFCNLTDDRIGNSMVSTEGDRESVCIFNLADSFSDRCKRKRIITVSACDIAEITDF